MPAEFLISPGLKAAMEAAAVGARRAFEISYPFSGIHALKLSSEFTRFVELQEALRSTAQSISSLDSAIRVLSVGVPRVDSWVVKTLPQLRRVEALLETSGLMSIPRLPTQVFLDSIASLKAAFDVYSVSPAVLADAMKLPQMYISFADSQLQRVESGNNDDKSGRLFVAEAVIDYAGQMLGESQSAFEVSIDQWATVLEEERPSVQLRYNVFSVLSQHLAPVYARNILISEKQTIAEFIPARIHALGCRIIELIYQINSYAHGLGNEAVFRPTNRTVRAALVIPNLIATNEQQFSEVVDYLFFALHEGSGSGKRLAAFTKAELEPLGWVKDLRLLFRHDVEHGEDIAKKLRRCGAVFEALIGSPQPQKTADWKNAQLKLYMALIHMLEGIARGLEARKG